VPSEPLAEATVGDFQTFRSSVGDDVTETHGRATGRIRPLHMGQPTRAGSGTFESRYEAFRAPRANTFGAHWIGMLRRERLATF
jgi:hypothetical protein